MAASRARQAWSLDARASERESASPDASHFSYDVTAVTVDDAWAVGRRYPSKRYSNAWIRHFDGKLWTQVRSPILTLSELRDVTAFGSDDVWAVGSFSARDGFGFGDVLVEHWDGGRWARVFAPRPGGFSELHGIDAAGPDDMWGVGIGNGCLTEHWDGVRWRVVKDATPRDADFCDLFGVTVVSSDDV